MSRERYIMLVEIYTMLGILFGLTADSIFVISTFWFIVAAVFMVFMSVYMVRAYLNFHFSTPKE